MNAVASCGLQLYRFGETVSIPYWLDDWRPDSWYDSWPDLKPPAVCAVLLGDERVGDLLGPRTKSWRTRKQAFIHCACLTSKSRSRQFLGGSDRQCWKVLQRCCKNCSIWTQSLLYSPSAKCMYILYIIYIYIFFEWANLIQDFRRIHRVTFSPSL